MVESVNSVNAATNASAAAAVSSTKEVEKMDKQEETKAKKTEEKQKTDEVTVKQSANAYDKATIQKKVTEYVETLKKTHDYPETVKLLTEYLDLFDIDKFMKTYPNITTESDFNTIMYNETIKYL